MNNKEPEELKKYLYIQTTRRCDVLQRDKLELKSTSYSNVEGTTVCLYALYNLQITISGIQREVKKHKMMK